MTSTHFSFLAKGHDPLFLQLVPRDPSDEPVSAKARASKRAP